MKILVPVRYPLNEHSKRTLKRALNISNKENDNIIILHVNLFYSGKSVKRSDLRKEVQKYFGEKDLEYIVRDGFIIEETIFEEAASQGVDMVVIGKTKRGFLRRLLFRLIGGETNIRNYLQEHLDVEVEIVQ